MDQRHIIENGKKIRDVIDQETYYILDLYEGHIKLRHIPKGRRAQKDDWLLSWKLFLQKCQAHEIRVEGYGYEGESGYIDEFTILELVVQNIIQEIKITKYDQELLPYKSKYERIEAIRKKRREKLSQTVIKKRREKRQSLEKDMERDAKRREIKKRVNLLNDMASNEADKKKSHQLAAEASYLQEQLESI